MAEGGRSPTEATTHLVLYFQVYIFDWMISRFKLEYIFINMKFSLVTLVSEWPREDEVRPRPRLSWFCTSKFTYLTQWYRESYLNINSPRVRAARLLFPRWNRMGSTLIPGGKLFVGTWLWARGLWFVHTSTVSTYFFSFWLFLIFTLFSQFIIEYWGVFSR